MKKSNRYLKLANRNLTNNFTGMTNSLGNITQAIASKFGMTITSTAATPISVALLPSYFRTLGIAAGALHYHNKQALINAGIVVDAIVDDGSWSLDADAGQVTISGTDPTKKITDYLEYIKYYTRSFSKIIIHSPNIATYSNSLKVQVPNPFNDSQRIPIDLNQYFKTDQYQDDKIELDLSAIDFPVTPDLLMLLTVPANSTVTVDFFFK